VKVAIVDLGSNTFKMTVADSARTDPTGLPAVVDERVEAPRIIQDRDPTTGALSSGSMARALDVLRRFDARARELGGDHRVAVATASLRGASNAPRFLALARAEARFEVDVASGAREAALSFAGARTRFPDPPLVVIDVGGRSTEVTAGKRGPDHAVSRDVGAVTLVERVRPQDPTPRGQVDDIRRLARQLLGELPRLPDARLVAVSGTALAVLGLVTGEHELQPLIARHDGRAVTRADLERWMHALAALPVPERVRGSVLPLQRADVILGGIALLEAAMDDQGAASLSITHRGLRYGLLAEWAARQPSSSGA
jgi:exopolyphosphatase/guanosine-5'-triphosphate,3'-diphosphate pyrophosphatase